MRSRAGLVYGLSAYTMWGIFPLYFRALSEVPPLIIVCHRILWSVLFLALVVSGRKEWPALWPALRSRRQLLFLCAGGVLIALNWLIFIYAISIHQVLQASLGYFINPLVSIALGMIFLRERLRGWQWVAVCVAVNDTMSPCASCRWSVTSFPLNVSAIVAERVQDGPGLVQADLDAQRLGQVRAELPALDNRIL